TTQPIASRMEVGRHPDGGIMIYFGTGKYFEILDNDIGVDPQVQSFYGIRDLNGALVEREDLLPQTITFEGVGTFDDGSVTSYPVRVTSPGSTADAPIHGWYMNLESPVYGPQGERVVSMPILRFGRIIFTTII